MYASDLRHLIGKSKKISSIICDGIKTMLHSVMHTLVQGQKVTFFDKVTSFLVLGKKTIFAFNALVYLQWKNSASTQVDLDV